MSLDESSELEADCQTVAVQAPRVPRRAPERSWPVWQGMQGLEMGGVVTVARARPERSVSNPTVGVVDKSAAEVFLEGMQMLAARGEIDAAMDHAFDTVDRWLAEARFGLCDDMLASVDESTVHEDLLVGLLTITYAARSRLTSRADFLARASKALTRRLGAPEAARSLQGLG